MYDKKSWLLTILTILAGLPLQAAQYNDGIAAVVGDEVITVYDVVKRSQPVEESLRKQYDGKRLQKQISQVRKEIATRMIHEQLLFLEAENRDLELPRKFINKRLDEVVVSQAGGSYKKFQEMLDARNMTLAEYRDQLKQQLTAQVLIDQFVRKQVKVTREDVADYYAKNGEQFRQRGAVNLRAIFLEKENDTAPSALQQAEELIRQLEDGADFATLAEKESDDPVSAAQGGELGWTEMTEGRQAFIEAVQNLEPGEVSKPVEQPEGVYLLQLVDIKDSKMPALDSELRRKINTHLEDQRFQEQYEKFISELREKYYVKHVNLDPDTE